MNNLRLLTNQLNNVKVVHWVFTGVARFLHFNP